MPNKVYGQKITQFKRYSKGERWVGQARLPEHRYIAFPYVYDTTADQAIEKFVIGRVVAKYPVGHALAGEVAPYIKDDANLR